MQREARLATVNDFDFIYDGLRTDLDEQGVLHRFEYSKQQFKDVIFGNNPLSRFLLLLIDGNHAGFANFLIDSRNFTIFKSPNLYLNDLYIAKAHRREGNATFLFEKLCEIAKREKCGRIEGVVLTNNHQALNFYNTIPNIKCLDHLYYMRFDLATN